MAAYLGSRLVRERGWCPQPGGQRGLQPVPLGTSTLPTAPMPSLLCLEPQRPCSSRCVFFLHITDVHSWKPTLDPASLPPSGLSPSAWEAHDGVDV